MLNGNRPPHPLCRWLPHWTPAVPPGSTLAVPRTTWLTPSPGVLEVAGLDKDGAVHWFHYDGRDPTNIATQTASAATDRYTAACLVGPGQVVAATDRNVVQWLVADRTALRPRAEESLAVPAGVVALVSAGSTGEILAILANGKAVSVAPGGRVGR